MAEVTPHNISIFFLLYSPPYRVVYCIENSPHIS